MGDEENGHGSGQPLVQKMAEDGLPEMDEAERDEAVRGATGMVFTLLTVPRLIWYAVAFCIYKFGVAASADVQIAKLKTSEGSPNLGYLYFAVWVFSILALWMNMSNMIQKAAVTGKELVGEAGLMRTNMMIYKSAGMEFQPYVVLEQEGHIGEYNRASRVMQHFSEYAAMWLVNMAFAGFVFPLPVLVVTSLLFVFRIWYQRAYIVHGFGPGTHLPPFVFIMACVQTLEGLNLITALKCFEVF